ncbi:MAG TPA: DUF5995 family protein [Bryobacteraceae bacterium]|nr:DUF5995 family protein [Bryobacteraceae bacterium]
MGKPAMPTKGNYTTELNEAQETLTKGQQVRDSIIGPKAQSDLAYWFAELYNYITTYEIKDRGVFEHPYFVMHFIPIFYDMYAAAAESYRRQNDPAGEALRATAAGMVKNMMPLGGVLAQQMTTIPPIATNWQAHFSIASTPADPTKNLMLWGTGVTQAIVSGVSAHINGDMANALVEAWKTFDAKYSGVPKLDAFHGDFFERNKPIFVKVRTDLINEVVNRGTGLATMMRGTVNPTFASDMADKLNLGLKVDDIYKWREDAWQNAKKALKQ